MILFYIILMGMIIILILMMEIYKCLINIIISLFYLMLRDVSMILINGCFVNY